MGFNSGFKGLNSVLDGGMWSEPRPGRFIPWNDPIEEAGWALGPVWEWYEKSHPPSGFDSRTVQPVASPYTYWAIPSPRFISIWDQVRLFWWPRGLRRVSASVCLLGWPVRILLAAWMSVVSVVCCQVEVSMTGWSLVQRRSTECMCQWAWSGGKITLYTYNDQVERRKNKKTPAIYRIW